MLEANDRVGGRLGGEKVDGFCIYAGADFICSTYDVAFRLCDQLGLSLINTKSNLGWNKDGKWVRTLPLDSVGNLFRSIHAMRVLGFLSFRGMLPEMRFFGEIATDPAHLSFASGSKLDELDDAETFGEHLDRIGVPEHLQATLKAFVGSAVMGEVENSGYAYMMTYVAEAMLKSSSIYVPEYGMRALAEALAEASQSCIRVSTPVRRVVISEGRVVNVVIDDGIVEADAVICAIPATKVPGIIPGLPGAVSRGLNKVTYSTGCRLVMGLDRPPLAKGWNGAIYADYDEPVLMLDRSINLPKISPPGKSTLDVFIGGDQAKELIQSA